MKAEWISDITEAETNEREAYFVDEGQTLPPPLRYWKHRHIVRKIDGQSSLIIDDISYETQNRLLDLLLYPLLWLAFFPRKFVYRRYFGDKSNRQSLPLQNSDLS
jgi:ligand-binding SRPBCC domain-containing protein